MHVILSMFTCTFIFMVKLSESTVVYAKYRVLCICMFAIYTHRCMLLYVRVYGVCFVYMYTQTGKMTAYIFVKPFSVPFMVGVISLN